MTNENSSPEQWLPPQIETPVEQRHHLTSFEKLRYGGALVVLGAGLYIDFQIYTEENWSAESVAKVAAVNIPVAAIGLGLALSVPEMRRRMANNNQRILNAGRRVVHYMRQPIGGPRQQG